MLILIAMQKHLLSKNAKGKTVATIMSLAKEAKDVFKYGWDDSLSDWKANQRGWAGAKKGKSLLEACPTQPRCYK